METRRLAAGAVAVLVLFGGGACGGGKEQAAAKTKTVPLLESVKKTCGDQLQQELVKGDMADEATSDDFLSLGDGGHSLTLSTPVEGAIATGLSITAMSCLLDETKAPDAVRSQVDSTTAMMGRQRESWGKVKASWSYHPDHGVNATFEAK